MSKPVFWEIYEKHFKMLSAEIAQRVVKVSNVLHAAGIRQYLSLILKLFSDTRKQ